MAELKSSTVWGDLTVKRNFTSDTIFVEGNDIVDFAPCDSFIEKKYGYPYIIESGIVKPATKYAQKNLIGISSDDYHFSLGKNRESIPISIGGFIQAYTDKVYKEGTPLTSSENGILTKIRIFTKLLYPERILATFYMQGKDRHWVKII